jgi:membrane-associated phospholipid phosphatase
MSLHTSTAAADSAANVLAGDVVTGLFPVVALATVWIKHDGEGGKQWLRDTAINEILNTSLRVAFNSTSWGERPLQEGQTEGGPYGFPSGHAGFVFCQAAFLQERYGWKFGVPALVLASAVSYVRVREDKHHWRDVIAGGALGYGVALLTVTPYGATKIAPIVGPDWLGIRFERSF